MAETDHLPGRSTAVAPYGLAFERAPITRPRRSRRPRATRSRPTLTVLAGRRRLAGMNATINPVPNDEDQKLAEQMADAAHAEGQKRLDFIRGCAIGLAGARMLICVKDTQLDYCDALLARCARAMAAVDFELSGGRTKMEVRNCLCELQDAGIEVPK